MSTTPSSRRRARTAKRAGAVLGSSLFLFAAGLPDWAMVATPVPVDRLVRNLNRYVAAHPDDARAHYTLARVHSMAYARGMSQLGMVMPDGPDANDKMPSFPPWDPLRQKRIRGDLTDPRRAHFRLGVRHHQLATKLAPKAALYWLGLGWMLDDGSAFAPEMGTPDGSVPEVELEAAAQRRLDGHIEALGADEPEANEAAFNKLFLGLPSSLPTILAAREHTDEGVRLAVGKLLTAHWRERALAAYRHAFQLALAADLERTGISMEGDGVVSAEAGAAIVRLLSGRTRTKAEEKELRGVRDAVRKLEAKPRMITPIVFPLAGSPPLRTLVDRANPVHFDLDGDGEAGYWPWVHPEAGILVWAPTPAAPVTSGVQLFGSVTWWIAWRDGYAPLAALDDNDDGWLAAAELDGIAVWRDANRNARSDPGEVTAAKQLGIARLAVRPDRVHDGVPAHGAGIEMTDGTVRPTYDWTPSRLPEPTLVGAVRGSD